MNELDENEDNEFDPNDPKHHLPDALKLPDERVLTRDQIIRRVRARHGIEQDEIDTLFPDNDQGNKELIEFYKGTVLRLASLDGGLDVVESVECLRSKVRKDNYKLSKFEQRAVKDLELQDKRRERIARDRKKQLKGLKKEAQKMLEAPEVKKVVEEEKEEKAKVAFNQAGAHLPKEDQVSYEEMQASLKDLLSRKRKK